MPPDLLSQLEAMGPAACPYCAAYPSVPCVFHRGRCCCARVCGDDGDVDGPGTCKGLPAPPLAPLIEVVLVPR